MNPGAGDMRAIIAKHRQLMNEGRVNESNQQVSDRYFGVFCLAKSGTYETYHAQEIREGNVTADRYYRKEQQKTPYWHYTDLEIGMRGDDECVVSSRIDFTLDGELIMHALVTEVYALEYGQWMLLRQYMEKYRPDDRMAEPHHRLRHVHRPVGGWAIR